MTYELRLGANFGAQINDNGQQRGDLAWVNGTRSDGTPANVYWMCCTFCATEYFSSANGVGKRLCPSCKSGLTNKLGKESLVPGPGVQVLQNNVRWVTLNPHSIPKTGKKRGNQPLARPAHNTSLSSNGFGMSPNAVEPCLAPPSFLRADDDELLAAPDIIDESRLARKIRDYFMGEVVKPGQRCTSWEECNQATKERWMTIVKMVQQDSCAI